MILLSAALFGVLAILVFVVLVYFPQLGEQSAAVNRQHEAIPPAGTVSSPPMKNQLATPGEEAALYDPHEISSKEVLKKLLELNSRLLSDNIEVWGLESYRTVVALIGEGDAHLQRNEYQDAKEKYTRAHEKLQQLDATKNEILGSALHTGMAALEKGDSGGAHKSFSVALAIDVDNQDAKEGLTRAQNLEAVLASIARGKHYEYQGNLKAALQEYTKGYELDTKFQPAVMAYERLAEEVKQQELKEHLSQFYLNLERKDLKGAEASLKDAENLASTGSAVKNAREILESAKEARALLRMRQKAENLMTNEDWQMALASYQQVLKVAPQADFAIRGVEVAKRNSELVIQLDTLLDSKERFQDEKVLRNGFATLEYALQQKGLGPRTTAKINDLDEALTRAVQPVKVFLYSDNLTDVTIYHVGRLGRFHQKELILKPGKYTIVGERAGYRVKRGVIELSPDRPEADYTIQCEEVF